MSLPPGSDPYGNPAPQSPDSPGWGQSGGFQQPVDAGWGHTAGAQPGYPQQAGYEQSAAYPPGDTQQGWQQPGGWQPQPGQPGGFPPPRRSNSVLITAGIAGVVIVVVAAVALVIVLNRHPGRTTASAASASSVSATTTTSSSLAESPATTSAAAPSGRFSYTEYAHDWNFKLDNVQLHADWVQGQDHPTCTDIENGGQLTALGCQYAAEMVYKAENGAVMLDQFVMGTPDSTTAGKLATQYTDSDLKMRPGTVIDNFATGKWQTKAQGDFVVLTVVTATNAVTEDTATKYMHYLEADMAGALMFR